MRSIWIAAAAVALVAAGVAVAQEKKNDRETKVRDDKTRVEADAKWIYDDLPRGIEEAKKSGKPLLVVFRCIPCEACAKLDEDVVSRDPMIAKLLDQFVCVRIPKANGMDLKLFQFDFDQSWAAFVLKPDLTVVARYGTRSSQKDSADDVSLEGLAKTLQAALDLKPMRDWQFAKESRSNQDWSKQVVKTPEELPSLKERYASTLDWQGKVVSSCMHCHMIREAHRKVFRSAGNPIPVEVLFPYPNPKSIGLVLDPKEMARVTSVVADSLAAKQGFRAGDEVFTMGLAPMLSIADVQWVLENIPDSTDFVLPVSVKRDGRQVAFEMRFPSGWRQAGDISWRASSWDLRRMLTGGILLEDLSDDERTKRGLDKTSMALFAKHVGQHGEHAAAKNAGFVKGDVLVAIDGRTERTTESALFAALAAKTKPGDKLPVTALRDGKKLDLTLPQQ